MTHHMTHSSRSCLCCHCCSLRSSWCSRPQPRPGLDTDTTLTPRCTQSHNHCSRTLEVTTNHMISHHKVSRICHMTVSYKSCDKSHDATYQHMILRWQQPQSTRWHRTDSCPRQYCPYTAHTLKCRLYRSCVHCTGTLWRGVGWRGAGWRGAGWRGAGSIITMVK